MLIIGKIIREVLGNLLNQSKLNNLILEMEPDPISQNIFSEKYQWLKLVRWEPLVFKLDRTIEQISPNFKVMQKAKFLLNKNAGEKTPRSLNSLANI